MLSFAAEQCCPSAELGDARHFERRVGPAGEDRQVGRGDVVVRGQLDRVARIDVKQRGSGDAYGSETLARSTSEATGGRRVTHSSATNVEAACFIVTDMRPLTW